MRILVANEYAGYFGGVEQNVVHTARGLRARGHRVELLYRARTDRDPEGYLAAFDRARPCTDLGAGEEGAVTVREAAGEDPATVVYLHRVPRVEPFLRLCGAHRVLRYVHDHDLACPRRHKYFLWNGRVCCHPAGWRCFADLAFLERDRSSPLGLRYVSIGARIRELRLHRGLDRVLAGSRWMVDELRMNGIPEERLGLLPPMVPVPERPERPPSGEPRVLYVGQLIRGKGVDLLLQALARVRRPFEADVVGAGNAAASLEALSRRLGLEGSVRFRGWVDAADLASLYEAAAVVAVPSRWAEPFGMIGLEAMSHGRALVGFAAGGIPDWLEDGVNGVLVPELDVPGLARAVEGLLDDPGRARLLGEQGRRLLAERFRFDDYLDRLEVHLCGSP